MRSLWRSVLFLLAYLPAYFMYRFRDRAKTDLAFCGNFEEFIVEYGKLLLVHSIRAGRITNEGRRQVREVSLAQL